VDASFAFEDRAEAVDHCVGATDHGRCRVSAIEPAGQADPARHAVEFGDGDALFSEQNVRPNDGGNVVLKNFGTLQIDQPGRLPGVEPLRDPVGLFAGDALAVEKIDSAVELQKNAAERVQFFGEFRIDRKWLRGDAPLLAGEKAIGGKLGTDVFGDVHRQVRDSLPRPLQS
jgi:hypothetical protein